MAYFRIFTVLIFFLISGEYSIFSQEKSFTKEINTSEPKTKIDQRKLTDKNKQLLELEKSTTKKIVSLFIILVIMVLVLFYFVYENNKLKQKNKRKEIRQKIQLGIINASIDAQENERKKIAAFLHDNINSLLSSVGLHLNAFSVQNNIQSEELLKAKSILEDAHDRLRDMSHELIPALLVRFGLIHALEDLCEKNSNSNLYFEFSNSIAPEVRYSEKIEMKIYFIVAELFNNIIKHSGANKAQISLSENQNLLIIIIHDNGKGFKAEKLKDVEGFGLNRIRARIKKYKGNISITSKFNEGTSIKIKIPVTH
ncbi:histidine kinase [Flavobacterium sp. ANB]|uniref:sensor histidine kinase n=1 Tax=unclassified Flavobacterium TaxID=196869 RepID=UPI0012B79B07|nr:MULTISPECIES: ATP-binding protein [unclassified Flavobacterium]MBF4518262.1 histidine kinase [Flavobacterium sp. ANB]MTD71040.1 histidine kinase [Flavobacterium sp. LC2016-13]